MLNLGLAQYSATNASLLQGAAPVLALLLAAAVLGEHLGARRVAAVAAAMAGVAVVTLSGGGLGAGTGRWPGAGQHVRRAGLHERERFVDCCLEGEHTAFLPRRRDRVVA